MDNRDYGIITGLNQVYFGLRDEIFQIFQTDRLYVDLLKCTNSLKFRLDYVFERVLVGYGSREIVNNTFASLRQMEVLQTYDAKLYKNLMDLFLYSVEPLIEEIVQGEYSVDKIVGLDFLAQENIAELSETKHALSVLKELDNKHPIANFRRSFDEYGTTRNLFSAMYTKSLLTLD